MEDPSSRPRLGEECLGSPPLLTSGAEGRVGEGSQAQERVSPCSGPEALASRACWSSSYSPGHGSGPVPGEAPPEAGLGSPPPPGVSGSRCVAAAPSQNVEMLNPSAWSAQSPSSQVPCSPDSPAPSLSLLGVRRGRSFPKGPSGQIMIAEQAPASNRAGFQDPNG